MSVETLYGNWGYTFFRIGEEIYRVSDKEHECWRLHETGIYYIPSEEGILKHGVKVEKVDREYGYESFGRHSSH